MKLRSNSRRILFGELEGDNYLLKSIEQDSVKYFLDIGANVGFISIMARMLHPKMKIFSVEPHPDVYENLIDNVEHLRIKTLNGALGNGNIFYLLKSRKTDLCNSFTDKKTENHSIQSYTLGSLVRKFKIDVDDLRIKIDCEGAEKYMIGDEQSENILRKCKVCAIEVHDKIDNDSSRFMNWFIKILENTHTINISRQCRSLLMLNAIRVVTHKTQED
ncbi:MAG: FkbM family methyltransferase [Petrotogales bacterium]